MLNYFSYQQQPIQLKTEITAGISTFLAMMYIIVVNPTILAAAGVPYAGSLTATVLVAALSSILMGVYAKNPVALAPGMGLNAFFAYVVVAELHVTWQVALGVVFWSGVIFLILSIFNVRNLIVKSIPKQLRYALGCGIGLFISVIGLREAGFIVSDQITLTKLGPMTPSIVVFTIGLIFTTFFLYKKIRASLIFGIIITSGLFYLVGYLFGGVSLPHWQGLLAEPDFSTFMQIKFIASLKFALWPVIFTFLFTDMFDSISTFIGVAEAGNMLTSDGEPQNLKKSMIVDALATIFSGIFGTSSSTAYIESAAGIEAGGRSGLTAVVAGLLFLPFMFLSPLISIVPTMATAPILLLVGIFMLHPIAKIQWQEFDTALPCFLAVLVIPLTNSITQGVVWSLITWTAIKLMVGKFQDVNAMLVILALLSVLLLIIS